MAPALFPALGRWATRRHPPKPPGGMRRQYFPRVADHRGGVSGTLRTSPGQTPEPRVMRWASTPITRPRNGHAAANPSAPPWARDVAARLGVTMAAPLTGRRSLRYRWREPAGLCPVWQPSITPLRGWHHHPLVWRATGGSDGAATRVWRHPNGHPHVQSHGVDVAKPRPPKGVRQA